MKVVWGEEEEEMLGLGAEPVFMGNSGVLETFLGRFDQLWYIYYAEYTLDELDRSWYLSMGHERCSLGPSYPRGRRCHVDGIQKQAPAINGGSIRAGALKRYNHLMTE